MAVFDAGGGVPRGRGGLGRGQPRFQYAHVFAVVPAQISDVAVEQTEEMKLLRAAVAQAQQEQAVRLVEGDSAEGVGTQNVAAGRLMRWRRHVQKRQASVRSGRGGVEWLAAVGAGDRAGKLAVGHQLEDVDLHIGQRRAGIRSDLDDDLLGKLI